MKNLSPIVGLILITTIQWRALSIEVSKDKVIMVIQMTRHGARAPKVNIQNKAWINQIGSEELTNVGSRQLYSLGINTKKRFPSLFNTTQKIQKSDFRIDSTGLNRTIQSAFSLATPLLDLTDAPNLPFSSKTAKQLFPPQPLKFAPESITDSTTALPKRLQAFATHSPTRYDLLMSLSRDTCKPIQYMKDNSISELDASLGTSKYFNTTLNKAMELLPYPKWRNDTSDFAKCKLLGEYVLMDYEHSEEPALGRDGKNGEIFRFLETCYFGYIYGNFKSPVTWKVNVSPVLMKIRGYFEAHVNSRKNQKNEKIGVSGHPDDGETPKNARDGPNRPPNGSEDGQKPSENVDFEHMFPPKNRQISRGRVTKKPEPVLKYALFSGHDETLATHLIQLGQTDYNCYLKQLKSGNLSSPTDPHSCRADIPPASDLTWELIETPSKALEVKFSFNGKYIDYCKIGQGNSSSGFPCPIEKFLTTLDDEYIYPGNYLGLCGFKKEGVKLKDRFAGTKVILIILATVLMGSLVTLCMEAWHLGEDLKDVKSDLKRYIRKHRKNSYVEEEGEAKRRAIRGGRDAMLVEGINDDDGEEEKVYEG